MSPATDGTAYLPAAELAHGEWLTLELPGGAVLHGRFERVVDDSLEILLDVSGTPSPARVRVPRGGRILARRVVLV